MAQDQASRTGVLGRVPQGEPPGGIRAVAARFALLPLRIFLGITFVYAGFDKLTDDAFLDASGPGSLHDTLDALPDVAIPALVDLAQKAPTEFGIAISLGEIAVGLGTLAGLWARLAATGGALISMTLWFTMSWSADPYYYGQDLPYMMAWTALILAGAPYWSLDSVLAVRRRRKGQQLFA
ncbi:DoxX family membrane protein [Streptomyces synnematoformans]|uniref:DoxX family membrane protein n=1 Tax=Streptomyces synnematoformans TaxID=415721 RepID=A0ABN1ZJK5_9ACTN